MNLNLLFSNISRAAEIAKVGSHSIAFIAGENADGSKVSKPEIAALYKYFELTPFTDDLSLADIVIEVVRPDADTMLRNLYYLNGETFKNVTERILSNTVAFNKTETILDKTSESLLKSAISKLQLSFLDVESITNVAHTIAAMANSDKIKVEHIAEAIQYKSVYIND